MGKFPPFNKGNENAKTSSKFFEERIGREELENLETNLGVISIPHVYTLWLKPCWEFNEKWKCEYKINLSVIGINTAS